MADSFSFLLPPLSEQVLKGLAPLQGSLDGPNAIHALANNLPVYLASGRPIASLREYIGDSHPPGSIEKAARRCARSTSSIADGLRAGIAHCSLLEVNHLSRGDKDQASASRQLKRMLESELSALIQPEPEPAPEERRGSSWTDSTSVRQKAATSASATAFDLISKNMEELDATVNW